MNDLMIHLLKSSCCMAALFLFYLLFLRRETFFQINRFFLLSIPLVSLLIPFIPAFSPASPSAIVFQAMLDPVLIMPESVQQSGDPVLSVTSLVMFLIGAGTCIMMLRLTFQIVHLFVMAAKGDRELTNNIPITRIPGNAGPFSFFNMIFLPRSVTDPGTIQTILLHEQVHIRQRHSADLILTELWTALFWFNPFIWLIRREIKTIHEYLADQGVIRNGIPVNGYRELIVTESTGIKDYLIVNAFNVSPLKKRLIMMTKKVSSPWATGKVALVIPLIAVLVLLFSAVTESTAATQDKNKKVVKSENPSTPLPPDAPPPPPPPSKNPKDTPDVMPKYPGGEEAMIDFLVKNIKYPEKAMKDSVQGKVFVQFKVDKDGSIKEIKLLRGIGYGCDEEAVRVIKMMPKWEPALKDGKPVQAEMALPIKFKLSCKKTDEGKNKKYVAPIPDSKKEKK